MLCIGHRGAAGLEPENTLRSVRRALEVGADGIEIDVHCLDGELVVIHDHSLNRTTNGAGALRHHTLAEARQLDAGKGERIPFLREVLDLVDRRALVNIELKGARTAAPQVRIAGVARVRFPGWGSFCPLGAAVSADCAGGGGVVDPRTARARQPGPRHESPRRWEAGPGFYGQ